MFLPALIVGYVKKNTIFSFLTIVAKMTQPDLTTANSTNLLYEYLKAPSQNTLFNHYQSFSINNYSTIYS